MKSPSGSASAATCTPTDFMQTIPRHPATWLPLSCATAKASFGITHALRDEVDGPVADLDAPLDHFSMTSLDGYLRKIDLYTTLEARSGRSRYGRTSSRGAATAAGCSPRSCSR